ncbi:hypothetical protein BCR32DRAFT_241174 [Anaeromyces robustus]|uniref:Uncharacterized protein n=1 Tax=Anaeromyces robustus TaxID=1754192 RepID=A0A1Y1XK95_9FUNG|nr:hypothetical protein BCR32DRAFT_241174 [Anaeromyces robustus]|eukprot:ORX86179.1 hypothetical protein BCR32DRAFT_241174 [Anaeromyces robustus]
MIIDNFDLIKEFIKNSCIEQCVDFDKDIDSYYHIQVFTRNKDFNEKGHRNDFSHNYYIFKIKDIDKYKKNIITLCHTFNARAYFGIRRKSVKRVLLGCNLEIAKSLANTSNIKPWKMVESVSLSDSSREDKKWVIDIDTKDISYITYIKNTIKELGGKCYYQVPTPNGEHIICTPFRFQEYIEKLKLDNQPFSNVNKCYETLLYSNVPEN